MNGWGKKNTYQECAFGVVAYCAILELRRGISHTVEKKKKTMTESKSPLTATHPERVLRRLISIIYVPGLLSTPSAIDRIFQNSTG